MKPVRFGSVALPPVTALILLVLVVVFIGAGLLANFAPGAAAVIEFLPVTPSGVLSGQVWRLVTYALLHSLADPFHLIINGLMIFFFGRELEERWGAGRYLLFALLTVLGGGIFVVLTGLVLPNAPVVGASAFAEGLIVAWGLTYPEREIRLFFAVPARGKHMIVVALFFWLLTAVSTSAISAAAHLGGIVTALIVVMGFWRPNAMKLGWASLLEKLGLKKKQKLYVVPKPSDQKWVN